MFGKYYYPRTFSSLLTAFMDMFNDITVWRYDDNWNPVKEIPVDIKFGPMHKFYVFKKETESDKRSYIRLPAMSVNITGMNFAADRVAGKDEIRDFYLGQINPGNTNFLSDIQPTPYDINMTLSIKTESAEDFFQIIEQICPYFVPSLELKVKEFVGLEIERNIKVNLDSCSAPQFQEEQGPEDVRYVNGEIAFTLFANLYKPIEMSSGFLEYISFDTIPQSPVTGTLDSSSVITLLNGVWGNNTKEINEFVSIP